MNPFRPIAAALAGFWIAFAACASAPPSLVALSPSAAVPGPESPPPQLAADRSLVLPLPFDAAVDRVYWDFPLLRRLEASASAIAIDLACDTPSATRAITLHLQSGGIWLTAQKNLEAPGLQTLYFQPSDFVPESGNPDWRKASTLRFSVWKGASRAASLTILSIRSHSHSTAILRGTELTAPGETALAAQCADRALRLLEKAGLPAAIVSDDLEKLDLRPYRLLVLPYNPRLSERQIDLLDRFVRRKGRLAVFYHSNPRLAQLLGFALRPYISQTENWNTVAFIPSAVTVARWLTFDGIEERNLPAATVSPRGLWFSHVPPIAFPSTVQWLLASLALSDPAHQPALDAYLARSAQRDAQASPLLAAAPPPPDSEIRAIWALPIPERLRETTMRTLAQNGVTAVFEHLATAGFLHYRADSPQPRSPLGDRRSRHFLPRALEFAATNHLELHAWVVCWSLDGIPDDLVAPLRLQGRLMQDAAGNDLPWLCPSHPDNRSMLLDALSDLARRGLHGIHLDYVRYPARDGCYSPATRAAFEKSTARPVADWPADVLPGAPLAPAYEQFRRDEITSFVAEAGKAIRAINPSIRFSAAVYPTPESAAENGQDWPRWLRDGLLDFASPMLYATDPDRFASLLDHAIAAAPSPATILPGIGTGADESQLDALATAQQILAARQRHTAGHALFQLDSELLSRIFPPLAPPPAAP